ncbi:MAG: conserved rane protein of unknown function [Flavipsychrobacter sp.]|nr:conserved rane protein of unknown function [Flavipsychrobacter sp.]
MELTHQTKFKEEATRWILCICGSLLFYSFIACIVLSLYHPDIEVLKTLAQKSFTEPWLTRPEPVEALLFRLGILIIIPGLLIAYIIFAKLNLTRFVSGKYFYIASLTCLLFITMLIIAGFTANNPFGPNSGDVAQNKRDSSFTNFDFYFNGTFLGSYLWLYALLFVPLIFCLFLVGFNKMHWAEKKNFRIASGVIGYGVIIASISVILLMNVFYFPYTDDNKMDLNAVYYSMTQVYAGVPLLVNGFTNTYGLYPHFLNPVFQLTGLSVFKFSLVLSVLTAIAFILNAYALRKLINNRIIFFLGVTSVLFFPYLDFKVTNVFDCFFSYYPIRYIVPSVLICLALLYFRKRNTTIYWLTFIVAAACILWNPEIGVVCYISWILVNIYIDSYTDKGRVSIKNILYHILTGIGIAAAIFYAYKGIIYVAYGASPDLSLLFSAMLVFGRSGFGMLPMSLVHPWNLMTIVLLLGFFYALVPWYKKAITQKSAMVLLISLIGLGYFVYFQGRSQNTNFATSSGFCLFLLTILGDELWTNTRKNNSLLSTGLFVIFLFIISFSFAELIYNAPKLMDLVYQDEDKNAQLEEQQQFENNTAFINNNSGEHEKIHMLAKKKYQALYFDGNKRVSAFQPGFIDLFFNTDIDRLERSLIDSSFSVFIEPIVYSYPFLARPIAAVAATYEFESANRRIALLHKRRNNTPAETFFNNQQQVLLHRKYNDDDAGTRLRINDAFGIVPINPDSIFSVQLLFHSSFQIFPDAVLLSNFNKADTSGFVIGYLRLSSGYYCSVNAGDTRIQPPSNQWIYYTINAYPSHLDVFINGDLIYTRHLPRPIRRSDNKLSIGNMGIAGEYNNYIGAISEVAITNKALDKEQINSKWQEIKQYTRQ